MINRITIRPACVNTIYVCFGSTDSLQASKLGGAVSWGEGLQACSSSSESPFTEETHVQSI